MTKEKIKHLKEYIVTIAVTCAIVVSLCLCIELILLFKTEQKVNSEELNIANLSKFCTIGELEKILRNEPNNYMASIRIAKIYESLNKFQKANEYYQNALRTSGRSNYSLYSYAMFCAKRNLFVISASLCEELSDTNPKTIEYKARIYEAIGDNLINHNEIFGANKAYQVAYKYAKNVKNKSFYSQVAQKYASSYSKLADYHVSNSLYEQAISDLLNSIKIKDTPVSKYKLALIYQNVDKVLAEKYMFDAFKKNPYIINPYIYNKILEDLLQEAKITSNQGMLNFYTLRHLNFKKKLAHCYLYKNEVLVDNSKIVRERKFISHQKAYFLQFDLKNNNKEKLSDLYMQIELYINSKQYNFEKKVIGKTNAMEAYDILEKYKIEIPQMDSGAKLIDIKKKNDIVVKYYAKKVQKAPWTLLKIDLIKY